MSSFDHYSAAEKIAKLLESEGKGEWSRKISNAMEESFSGTEILMALRWHLKECLDSLKDLSPTTVLEIKRLLVEIDPLLE